MEYEQLTTILEQFEKNHPFLLMRDDIHGIQVISSGYNDFVLEILVKESFEERELKTDEKVPDTFEYNFNGSSEIISTRTSIKSVPRPLVDYGDSATYSATGTPVGTAGWNVFLQIQNIWVCVTNHHVIVNPTNSNFGDPVFLDGSNNATLHARTLNEDWDFALARYNDPEDANQQFRQCSDETRFPNAQKLSKGTHVNEKYYTVGNRAPICKTGTLLGVATREVGPYPDGSFITFRNQLVYEPSLGDKGDSGSIVVREADNTVTGLIFAGDDDETSDTLANPLFKIGWLYKGTIKLEGGGEVPIYDESNSLVPVSPDILNQVEAPDLLAFSISNDLEQIPLNSTENLVNAGGSLFLGVATSIVINGRHDRWENKIPPAIRDIDVVAVFYRRENYRPNNRRSTEFRHYFLCFG